MYRKNLYYLTAVVMVLAIAGNAAAQPTGEILFEYWFGIGGTSVSNLTDNPRFPDNPDDSERRTSFEGEVNWNDNYGTRVRGYVYPPETGAYNFWISGDDECQLFLSTDDDPANASMIAEVATWTTHLEWDKEPGQKSDPINLVAGEKYYIEALMKEGGGGDSLTVGWGGPSIGAGPEIIAGDFLSPFIRPIDLMASAPDPADGAIHPETWVTLIWQAGLTAVSHDVYFSDVLADVEAGTGDAARGNQTDDSFIAGFPGFPYPDGLVPGTTYYWRIDEVEADGTIHTGNVWSLMIPPTHAYAPSPSDGGQYVDTEPTLAWSAGFGAKLHNVVFGDNFDDVNSAPDGSPLPDPSFSPGTLEAGKTYYWRVDEFNPPTTVKGPVWTFTTLPELPIDDPNLVAWYKFEVGEGTRIVDFSGHDNHAEIIDNVLWVPGQFNLGLEFLGDNEGHVEMPAGLVTTASGSIALWVNTDQTGNEGMFWYGTEGGGDGFGGQNELHIHNQDSGALGFAMEGSTDVRLDGPMLAGAGWNHVAATWDAVDGCRLYFNGAEVDFQAHTANIADLSAIRLGRPISTGNGNRYHDGLLDDVRLFDHAITAAQVNEIMTKGEDPRRAGAPSPSNGSEAPINVATTLTWSTGEGASEHDVYFGTEQAVVADADASDTTGVYKGRQNATSYTPDGITMDSGPFYWRIDEVANDGTIVEGGVWSFTVADYALVDDFESYNDIPAGEPGSNLVYVAWVDGFDNPNVNGSTMGYVTGASMETGNVHGGNKSVPFQYDNTTAGISEVVRTFTPAQDWTAHGVITLSLWFAGDAANVPGQLYVKINGTQVDYDGDMSNLTRAPWQPWNIDLTKVNTNLSNVTSMAIGIQGAGATGTLLLDDIRLYAKPRELATPVQPGTAGLVAQFNFEGNVNDSAGGHNGTANGGPLYAPGKFGQAISLDGIDDHVVVGSVGISGDQPRTIAGWAKANVIGNPAWVNVFGFTGPSGGNGHFDIELVGDTGTTTLGWYGLHVYGWEQDIIPIDLEWHHLGASYDGTTLKWYGDGLLIGSEDRTIDPPDNVHVGKREDNSNYFPGQVDDFRIYDRVLSDEEMAGLAGITQPYDKPL